MTFTPLASDFYGFAHDLSPAEQASLAEIREFMETRVRPEIEEHWHADAFPMHLIPGIAALGVVGPAWPETARFENSAVYRGWIALEMSRVDASVSTFAAVQNGLVAGSIGVAGSPEQRAEWLPRLADCSVVGAFGLTEPLSGSDASKGLSTTARREGDEWVLDGEKRWIGNATHADIVIVWARDEADGEVKGFIVPTDAPGFSVARIERKIALRMVQNGHIELRGVRVPEALRLQGASSFRDTARVLRLTRAEVAWSAVGIMIGAYEAAVRYTTERTQFGKPIAGHQLVQDLLAKSLGSITASIALCVQVSRMLDEGRQGDAHSALAKAFTTTRMREVVAWCREVCGGNGIVTDYDVARFFVDAEAIYTYEGTAQMNSLIVGRAITGASAFA
ncbi:acyl-CoA dehydrogenase family protein [Agrococcus sp. HG114]|uniref:acyl-CoA dehydrogenase family protein n=1 Tax=Agrococcus sp. HG114 TaxID=2969757 RepID=UPI00215A185E|nr:acyl-CoA dehydrogenase family protein [Agrococcus sp. HG114]MCR8670418.1 acyl-CoA dehydrogenase family protein [Agrococcus sp. HG114]